MSQDKEREAFEAWAKTRGYNTRLSEYGHYPSLLTALTHEGWQARAALASQQAVKGELVAWIQCSRSPEDGYEQELAWHKDDDLEGGLYEYMPLYASPPSREPLTEWEARGMLARLKCWHRLTEDEAADLVEFARWHGVGR